MKIELGLTSFAENSDIVMSDGKHESISHAQRIRNIGVESIELFSKARHEKSRVTA